MASAEVSLPALALLAGGLATRLRPVTETVPKSMLPVAGEPFIAHQLRRIAGESVGTVVICGGHLGGQIEDFVGDGSRFGLRVRYSWDGPKLLGTGGALRRALPLLGESFLVMYGDSLLPAPFAPVWRAFRSGGMPALMTVFRNEGRWDASNVEFADGVIRVYDKVARTPRMHYIDYGLGAVAAATLAEWPGAASFDLADFYRGLACGGRLAGCEVAQRFYEIGSPEGLAETRTFLETGGPA